MGEKDSIFWLGEAENNCIGTLALLYMWLAKNHSDSFEFVKVMHKILLV